MSSTSAHLSRVSPRFLERARELHTQFAVVDLHNDFLLKNRLFGRDFLERNKPQIVYTPWRTDLDVFRVREAGVTALGFALFCGFKRFSGDSGRGGFAYADDLFDRLERLVATSNGELILARTADDIRRAHADGLVAAFCGIEGAQAIEDDLAKLDHFYRRGVRYVGLTWNTSPSFAGAAYQTRGKGPGVPGGLNDLGREVVRRMNELGMMIDLAHASEQTAWDVLEESTVSPFNSHTGFKGAHDHERNMSDELAIAVADAGGVMGVIFCPTFLGPVHSSISRVADHIDHLVTLTGPHAVAYGSDFDGFIPLPRGMRDVRDLPVLTAMLLERGHPEEDVVGYLGENFLRYFASVTPTRVAD